MAIPAGHRVPITFDELFPQGFYVISVERANDWADGKTKPAVCKLTGRPVWTVQGTDPSAKGKNTGQVVKIAADYQPVPPETMQGTPFRPAVFTGLKVTPYVRDGWVNYTIWADEMHSALPANRGGAKQSAKPAGTDAAAA